MWTKENPQNISILFFLTLKSWTPMQANIKSRSMVTSTIFPMVLTATNTHWTTCYRGIVMIHMFNSVCMKPFKETILFKDMFYLQSFGSVNGPQWPQYPQNPQNLHHRDSTGSYKNTRVFWTDSLWEKSLGFHHNK